MGFFSSFSTYDPHILTTQNNPYDEFIELFLNYVDGVKKSSASERSVTLIARSPESLIAQAIARHAADFSKSKISVQSIFSHLEPPEVMSEWLEPGSDLSFICNKNNMRWAKNPDLLEAHEQLILGRFMCWSGDVMRRQPGKIDTIGLFERNCQDTALLGKLAFEALWNISEKIPVRRGLYSKHQEKERGELSLPEQQEKKNSFFISHFHQWLPTRH